MLIPRVSFILVFLCPRRSFWTAAANLPPGVGANEYGSATAVVAWHLVPHRIVIDHLIRAYPAGHVAVVAAAALDFAHLCRRQRLQFRFVLSVAGHRFCPCVRLKSTRRPATRWLPRDACFYDMKRCRGNSSHVILKILSVRLSQFYDARETRRVSWSMNFLMPGGIVGGEKPVGLVFCRVSRRRAASMSANNAPRWPCQGRSGRAECGRAVSCHHTIRLYNSN